MGGIIYGVFRSIRGLPTTIERVAHGRGWGGRSHSLFPLHAEHGITDDGSPTGFEHAIVYIGLWGPVLQLRAQWCDRAGARKFRELLRTDDKDQIGFAIAGPFQRFEIRPRHEVPYPTYAFDLDVLHAIAAAATDHSDFVQRLKQLPRDSLIGSFAPPAEPFRAAFDTTDRYDQPIVHPPISDPTERALIEEIRATPSDPAPAHVYADWLDERGRSIAATAVRPMLHTSEA